MQRMMRPRSVAIVGASSDGSKYSGRPLVYLRNLGFSGGVFPVNPEAVEIAGYRCLASISDLPEGIDVAVIARPAARVVQDVADCLARGIRAFVVFSGGFAEAGEEGAALQQQLAELCGRSGAVLCGPNCTGLFDAPSGAAMSFMSHLDQERGEDGSVALVSSSGSIAAMLYQGRGRAIRSAASIGNEAVTTAAAFIADAIAQPAIGGVIAFLETIREPAGMAEALRLADAAGKPVALLKGGRTQRSALVAATHTGAMIDDDVALQAMLESRGAIRAESIEELKLLATLMHATARRSFGPGIGVLTPSGGTAVLIVDELEAQGLELPQLSGATCAALRELIPQASPANPMDITGFGAGSQRIFAQAVGVMLADPAVDVLLVPMGGAVGPMGALRARALIEAHAATDKLLLPIWQGTTRNQPGHEALLDAQLPVTTDYALLVRALAKLIAHRMRRRPATAASLDTASGTCLPPAAVALLRAAARSGACALNEVQVKAMLRAAGVAVPAGQVLPPAAPVPGASRMSGRDGSHPVSLAFPAVLKVLSAEILHKSAVGGVAIVDSDAGLPAALDRMAADLAAQAPQCKVEGFLLEEMVGGGLELMVGIKRDAHHGLLLTLALGGTWANCLRGAVTVLLPLEESGARALIRRFFAQLDDEPATAALADALLRLAAVAQTLGDRLEVLEVNPLKLFGGSHARVVALDGVLSMAPARDPAVASPSPADPAP